MENKIFFTLLFMFIAGLYVAYTLINKSVMFDRKKSSPFECGFDMIESSRKPFSIRFFSILIIFLIFDVELVILLSSPISKSYMSSLNWSFTLIFFMLILLYGLGVEWKGGLLSWF